MDNREESRRAMCRFPRDFVKSAKSQFAIGNRFGICFTPRSIDGFVPAHKLESKMLTVVQANPQMGVS